MLPFSKTLAILLIPLLLNLYLADKACWASPEVNKSSDKVTVITPEDHAGSVKSLQESRSWWSKYKWWVIGAIIITAGAAAAAGGGGGGGGGSSSAGNGGTGGNGDTAYATVTW